MVGIQIHSVDNNAAVPWEQHTYKILSGGAEKHAAGCLYHYGDKGLTAGAGFIGEPKAYYLSLTHIEVEEGQEVDAPFICIRDDMVLEAYAFDSEDNPIKLGDKTYELDFDDVEGRRTIALTNMEAGISLPFEVVGIITDCDVEYADAGGNESNIVPLTKKVLVRLIK